MAKGKKKNKVKAQAQPVAKSSVPDMSLGIEKVISNNTFTAVAMSSTPPVLMKVCRLCNGKEGPFLNIFDQDQITAIKIDQLMPFRIEENDDLPHKICFRCSAKLEELHEFVSKCIKTQENLHDTMGKRPPVISKSNTRQMWEEKLNKSNLTNDDICDALIKKAMEGIKEINDIPLSPPPEEREESVIAPKKEIKTRPGPLSKTTGPLSKTTGPLSKTTGPLSKTTGPLSKTSGPLMKTDKPGPLSKKVKPGHLSKNELRKIEEENNVQFKEAKLTLDKCDEPKRSTRSRAAEKQESPIERKVRPSREATRPVIQDSSSSDDDIEEVPTNSNPKITDLSFDYDEGPHDSRKKNTIVDPPKKTEPEPPPKPFNIMDHVCMIKVNGVGVLFQCKLCNRNFLKKEVVQTHSCAKNGVPKVDLTTNLLPPEPPKITTVKYINTKNDQKKVPIKEEPVKQEPVKPEEVKPKPRIGPASRVKHNYDKTEKDTNVSQPTPQIPATPVATPPLPVVNFPSIPGLNGRFRLVPGPNNTFTLMEDSGASNVGIPASPYMANHVPSQISNNIPPPVPNISIEELKKSRKRKSNPPDEERSNRSLLNVTYNSEQSEESIPKDTRGGSFIDLVDVDDRPNQNNSVAPPAASAYNQPYPVGLFHTLSRALEPPTFTTPAMKKQSYTIVQTGNPSKLLISTKPQVPVEEVPKKRQKKVKAQKSDQNGQVPVTVNNTSAQKDPGFFTFINVDPMSQSSYILPTDNIIQESQISTSTAAQPAAAAPKDKDKYSCNMCNETFTREKKLLAHIQSHYSKMDEEDQLRAEKSEPKRRNRKS